jgi:hypothetical protein
MKKSTKTCYFLINILVATGLIAYPASSRSNFTRDFASENKMIANQPQGRWMGRVKREGAITACNEAAGVQAGRLQKISLDISSDTLGCDFDTLSVGARASRACEISYGSGSRFGERIIYKTGMGHDPIPVRKMVGCFSW